MNYFLHLHGRQEGPFTLEEVREFWRRGEVNARTLFWEEGLTGWLPLSAMHRELEATGPLVARAFSPGSPVARSEAMRGNYIILGLMFGPLGLHNFYTGRNWRGGIQFALTFFFFWTLIIPFGLFLMAVFEVITTRTDARGRELR